MVSAVTSNNLRYRQCSRRMGTSLGAVLFLCPLPCGVSFRHAEGRGSVRGARAGIALALGGAGRGRSVTDAAGRFEVPEGSAPYADHE